MTNTAPQSSPESTALAATSSPHTVAGGSASLLERVTRDLPPLGFRVPETIEEILHGGASVAGLSAVTSFLSCPEYARLRSLGVQRKRREADDGPVDVSEPTDFGLLMHALRATRLAYGMQWAMWLLASLRIDEESRLKANNALRVYDSQYPIGTDPWDYLGIEVEVFANIGDGRGGPLVRSVRYDSVIRMHSDGAIFSFECKTSARSGTNALSAYATQRMAHAALWNACPELVAKHGPMRGTLYDLIVKTEVPKCERVGPIYIDKFQQQRVIEYMRLPEAIPFPVQADGSHPRMLHSCFGRFKPCVYTGLCLENSPGDFEIARRA